MASTRSLSQLFNIVSRLTDREKQHVEASILHLSYHKSPQRTIDLFTGIAEAKDHTEIKAPFLKQHALSPAAFNRLVRQLRMLIERALLYLENYRDDAVYDKVAVERMELLRRFQALQLTAGKAEKSEETLEDLKAIYARCLHYEFHELALHIVEFAMDYQYDAIEDERDNWSAIKALEHLRKLKINAKSAYYNTLLNYSYRGNSRSAGNTAYKATLADAVSKLKTDFEQTGSPTIGFYYYLLQIEAFQVEKRFDKASEYCLHQVEIIRNNPSVYMKRRLGIAYLNLCENELYNHYFEYARGFASQAAAFFKQNSRNFLLSLELEFYAAFYQGDLQHAAAVLSNLMERDQGMQRDARDSWHYYNLACLAFLAGENRAAHRTLHKAASIHQDAEGGNMSIRILHIMNMIDLQMHDHADRAIDNLTKFIQQSKSPVRLRDQAITQMLAALKALFYDFSILVEQHHAHLSALAEKNGNVSWEIMTPELVVFHKWVESKAAGKPYLLDFSPESIFSFST